MSKTVLVTGGLGFIGKHFVSELLYKGHNVINVDCYTYAADRHASKLFKQKPNYIESREYIHNLGYLPICDYVEHFAAESHVDNSIADSSKFIHSNITGTHHLLELLRRMPESHRPHLIHISTDEVYGDSEPDQQFLETDILNPSSPYSASKAAAELVIRAYVHSYFNKSDSNIKIVSVRAGNVIGGGDWALNRIVPDCIKAWVSNHPVSIRNPNSTRPWQHVLEPLSGYLRVGQLMNDDKMMFKNGEPYNFGPNSDQNYTVLELLKQIKVDFKATEIKKYFNIDSNSSFHEAGLLKLNCDKALFQLQWKPVLDFKQTAFFTSKWYDNYYNKEIDLYDFTNNQIDEYHELAKIKSISWAI